jgi:tetratricopeptide (TPR) repeat protein
VQTRLDVAHSLRAEGILLYYTGDRTGARRAWEEQRDIATALEAESPTDAVRAVLARSHSTLAVLLMETGKPAEALQAFQKAFAIQQQLADAHPAVLKFQHTLAQSHNLLGRLFAHQQRFAEAIAAIDAGLAIRQKLAKADPKSTEYPTDLGYSHAYRGWALVRSGRPSQAAADLRQAVALWAKAKAPNPETRFERSLALALLAGRGGDAQSGVTPAEAAAFADQAVAALGDAIKAGWNRPNELKEPDFDPLRGRADFQKLVAEVEAKAGPKAKPKG